MTDERLFILLGYWLGYFAVHSLLASHGVKHWVGRQRPAWMPSYRLAFNLLSLVLLLPIAWMLWSWRAEPLWQWPGLLGWLMNGLALAALLLFFWSLRYYDGAEFLGLRQLAEGRRQVNDGEPLVISPLHRCVRHPWYSLGLVLVWSQPMDWAQLVSALAVSLYLVVGSAWEERRLLALHGERYARYRERVPGLVPRPWRCLDEAGAKALLKED